MNPQEWQALHGLLHLLETRWNPLPIPDTSVSHAYDPLPLDLFLDGLRAAQPHVAGRRFLDVGCGVGSKLAFMQYLGWDVAGIERHGPYVDVARELASDATVTHADAFDVERFDADLVFMYRPMVSDIHQRRLEQHVVSRLASGTVLWIPARRVDALNLMEVRHDIGVA